VTIVRVKQNPVEMGNQVVAIRKKNSPVIWAREQREENRISLQQFAGSPRGRIKENGEREKEIRDAKKLVREVYLPLTG